jgi:hypothetical protein
MVQALEQLHSSFMALGKEAAATPAEMLGQPGSLAFSTFFSLIFSAAARVSGAQC